MEEEDIDNLYSTIADLAVNLSMEHNPLKIAAVLNAVGMSIYKTALTETDYEKMCETIYDLRHDVNTFQPVWEDEGGTVH
jgi:hypothetical protein